MLPILEYLKSPELVVKCQEFFGVKYLPISAAEDENNESDQNEKSGLHKRNISSGSSDEGFNEPQSGNEYQEQNTDDDSSTTNTEHKEHHHHHQAPFIITNRFWYYLFVIGTEFGDEIFYATMIPFWFWNIDGAVGRRVVFVWAIVMYIGEYKYHYYII